MPSDHPPLSAPDTSLTVTTTPRRLGSRMTAQTGPCAKPSPRPVYSPRATLPKHSSPRNPRIAQPTQAENNQRYSNNQSYSQTLNQLTPSQPTKQPTKPTPHDAFQAHSPRSRGRLRHLCCRQQGQPRPVQRRSALRLYSGFVGGYGPFDACCFADYCLGSGRHLGDSGLGECWSFRWRRN